VYQQCSQVSAASEGAPTKDSLGPRIWTGTHFLPRFVRAADVPGEGSAISMTMEATARPRSMVRP
jgi:hypothetical protein